MTCTLGVGIGLKCGFAFHVVKEGEISASATGAWQPFFGRMDRGTRSAAMAETLAPFFALGVDKVFLGPVGLHAEDANLADVIKDICLQEEVPFAEVPGDVWRSDFCGKTRANIAEVRDACIARNFDPVSHEEACAIGIASAGIEMAAEAAYADELLAA